MWTSKGGPGESGPSIVHGKCCELTFSHREFYQRVIPHVIQKRMNSRSARAPIKAVRCDRCCSSRLNSTIRVLSRWDVLGNSTSTVLTHLSHDEPQSKTTIQALATTQCKSWRFGDAPSCLGGSSHGWVLVNTHYYTRAWYARKAVGGSLTTNTAQRHDEPTTLIFFNLFYKVWPFFIFRFFSVSISFHMSVFSLFSLSSSF